MNRFEKTYVNPISLPDYPIGRLGLDAEYNWREAADPTVLYDGGIWYLYPSCGMVYRSEDLVTWKKENMEPSDIGYAPTVVKHRGEYLLCASLSPLYVSKSPTGPFHPLGDLLLPTGEKLERCYDPMLFYDGDGRLYLYFTTGEALIMGAELDAKEPTRLLTFPAELIRFDPSHVWERNGENNEDGIAVSFEGPWMFKKNGIYYLTYAAPGTEYSTYAVGAYKGKDPLGPFDYMRTSPFISKRDGIVRGPGHGCITEGDDGVMLAFYTTALCYLHPFERRIGFDRIVINEDGDLVCPRVTETPRFVPGSGDVDCDGETGLLPLTARRRPTVSSSAPGRDGIYATDEDLLSWWQPAEGDECPTLEIPIAPVGMVCCAFRIIWREVGLSLKNGVLPGAIRYRLEVGKETESGVEWVIAVDRSDSRDDMTVDYRTFDGAAGDRVRLTVLESPRGITPGVINITVFGYQAEE